MIDIVLFSVINMASGFAPNLQVFIGLRALFGIAMGGEWVRTFIIGIIIIILNGRGDYYKESRH